MPSALQVAGSAGRPTRFVPLFVDEIFTGLWTQRNPFRDAATQYVTRKFYGASRFDSIIDGLNTEISSRLTLTRAPGSSVYNSQTFDSILQFVSFSRITGGTTVVKVVAQQGGLNPGVYNATGPSTKTLIANTLSEYIGFVQVYNPNLGNVLLFGQTQWDGMLTYQWGISDFFPNNAFLPSPDAITPVAVSGSLSPTVGYSWVFEYFNSVTGDYSNASDPSIDLGPANNVQYNLSVTGGTIISSGIADQIAIFRTLDGGSTYFWLANIPNPGTGSFTYTDNNPDSALNIFQQAAVALENSAIPLGLTPGVGFTSLAYHLGLVWGAIGNVLYYSRPNSAVLGNGFSGFPPGNNFIFSHKIVQLVSNALGLFVFTESDIQIIQGNNTATNPLWAGSFLKTYGFQSPVAICEEGALVYAYTTTQELISIDPNAGISEVGFPIGDQFPGFTTPATTCLTYHRQSSGDKALYITSPTQGEWYRMAAVAAPETGFVWNPKRVIGNAGSVSATQSIEVSAGLRRLLIGPGGAGGPILMRDPNTSTDNGIGYESYATFGSIVLAQPSQAAELLFIGVDARKSGGGTIPAVSVVLDEPYPDPSMFEALPTGVVDPPFLPPALTYYGERFYFSQAADPAWCRSIQIKLAWPVSTVDTMNDEVLSFSLIGAHWNEN